MKDDELFNFKDDFGDLDDFKDDFKDEFQDDYGDLDDFQDELKDDFDDSFLDESDDFDFADDGRAFDFSDGFSDGEIAVSASEPTESEQTEQEATAERAATEEPPREQPSFEPQVQNKEGTLGHGTGEMPLPKYGSGIKKDILRDATEEHTFGIEDVKLYFASDRESGRVAVYGQIIAARILAPLRIKLSLKPKEEGGLLGSDAPSGVTLKSEAVVPYFFFNRYPFRFNLPYTAEEIEKVDALLTVERDESTLQQPTTTNLSNLKITLTGSQKSAPVTLGKMKTDEKFPQDRIAVFREEGLGFTDFSFTLQKMENGMFRATDICSGNVGQAVRVTAMYFNVAGDLIHLERDLEHAGKKDFELHKHDLALPYFETLAQIVVYVSPTPAAIEERMRQKFAGRTGASQTEEFFTEQKEISKRKKFTLLSVLAFIFGPFFLVLGIILESSATSGTFFIILGIVLLITGATLQRANKNEKK